MHRTATNLGAITGLAFSLSACATLGIEPSESAATKQSLELAPVLKMDNAPVNLDGAVAQAQAQRKAGDLNSAIRTLSQLVLIAPDDARVVGEYGKTLVAKGQTSDAIAFLSRALELQPGDWTIYSALGIAQDQQGDYEAAKLSYDRALVMKPGEPVTLSNAGLSRMQAGDIEGAESLLLQAIQAGGDYPRITQNLALIQTLKRNRTAAPTQVPTQAPATAQSASVTAQPAVTPALPAPQSQPPAPVAALPSVPAPTPLTQRELPSAQAAVVEANPTETREALAPETVATAAPVPLDPTLALKPANHTDTTSIAADTSPNEPPRLRLRTAQ